jgi:CMP-N-acetylneuraminic acid synthetase
MKLLAIIPAKKHSERFPGKNMAEIDGRAMIDFTMEAAYEAKIFDKIVVITDDVTVDTLARDWKFQVLRPVVPTVFKGRVKESCQYVVTDKVAEGCTHFCLLLPTNPLRSAGQIVYGYGLFSTIPEPDYVVSVSEYTFNARYALKETFSNQQGILNYMRGLAPLIEEDIDKGREHFGPTYFMDGAVYWAKIDAFIRNKFSVSPTCPNTVFFKIPREDAYEVDTPFDLKVAEALMKERE